MSVNVAERGYQHESSTSRATKYLKDRKKKWRDIMVSGISGAISTVGIATLALFLTPIPYAIANGLALAGLIVGGATFVIGAIGRMREQFRRR